MNAHSILILILTGVLNSESFRDAFSSLDFNFNPDSFRDRFKTCGEPVELILSASKNVLFRILQKIVCEVYPVG